MDAMTEGHPLRVVIVDDEPLARAVIREYLKAHPDVDVVAGSVVVVISSA